MRPLPLRRWFPRTPLGVRDTVRPRRGHGGDRRFGRHRLHDRLAVRLVRDLDDDGVGGPHSGIERRRGKRTSQEHRRADQQQRRRAHLQANQEISRPSWPRVPDHFAPDRPDRFDARRLQRRGEPEQHGRDAGAGDEKQQHAPVRVGYQQSEISEIGRPAGHHRVDDRLEHHARDREADRGSHQRQQQALRQQLADDAAAGGAERQPDANLTLSRHGPGEEQVGDVGTANQQDEAERKEQGRDHGHRFERLLDGTAPRYQRDVRTRRARSDDCRSRLARNPRRRVPPVPSRATGPASAVR